MCSGRTTSSNNFVVVDVVVKNEAWEEAPFRNEIIVVVVVVVFARVQTGLLVLVPLSCPEQSTSPRRTLAPTGASQKQQGNSSLLMMGMRLGC
jgi:hypothetical protein